MISTSEKLTKALNFHNNGKLTDARDLYLEILTEEPQNAQVLDFLGVLYGQVGKFQEAEEYIKRAIEIEPRFYYLENLAKLYKDKGDFNLAIDLYESIVEHNPTYENYFNLAMSYKEIKSWENAKLAYYKALKINPKGYESYFNLAYLAMNDSNPEEAVKCYEKALEINPDDWESMYFISLAYMQTKNYTKGLEWFESRLCRKSAIVTQEKVYPELMKRKPLWDGKPHKDKILFTYYEAGFGDMLMFYRYMPILTSIFKKVIFKPQTELAPLFQENSYGAEILNGFNIEKKIDFDYHIPFLSIPYVLGMNENNIFVDHDKAYLLANPNKTKYYKEKFFNNDKFKIGIKWQGNAHYDKERILNVEDFFPLFQLPNTQFYSCQTLEGSEEFEKIKSKYDVIDLGSTFKDFSDTASAIENMDLVIANDTSLIHLSGAMKKSSMVLLPHVYNWRWHTDITKCDWYDTVKIYRQNTCGDWSNVFSEVETDLKKMLHNYNKFY